jgi:endo-1,4-beta-D-glucanase Y
MKLKKFSRGAANYSQHNDALEDGYATWQEESGAVAESYRSWNCADGADRWLAYAAYLAALDREERAASAYRELVERVQAT